jgi:tryptophan synthase beta chain
MSANDKQAPPKDRRDDLGDTERLVFGKDDRLSLALGEASTHEILDLVVLTLKEFPERGDLWMMRFEIQRTVGLKHDFIQAMREGYANPRFRRNIDWAAVQRMWEEMAPGEPPPADIVLPRPTKPMPAAERAAVTRRFSDLALQLAGPELAQLSQDYQALRARPDFFTEFARGTRQALRRPTPLQRAKALEEIYESSAHLYLKREDLHDSTPELEMAVAQAHIAKMLGRHFILAGNDVDDFSLALARVAPAFGLKASIVVGLLELDAKPEFVAELRKLGAAVETYRGDELKSHDPREGALRMWARTSKTNHLAMSFGTGPNPYPRMVSDFQMLLGYECELQLRGQGGSGRPRALVAAVHSEADSIGFMLPYLKRSDVELFYAEPAAANGKQQWKSSARLRAYGGARREHAWLHATGRITHMPISDDQAAAAQEQLRQLEGISVSLEDARAVALATGLAKGTGDERDIAVLVA